MSLCIRQRRGLDIIEINDFSLETHEGVYEEWPDKSRLFKGGEYVGRKISGYQIERQFQSGNYYFIVTSYDCPFEEQCDFILLNENYKQIAQRSLIPWGYSSWNLKTHEYLGDNQFVFKFNGDRNITVKLNLKKIVFWGRRISLSKNK